MEDIIDLKSSHGTVTYISKERSRCVDNILICTCVKVLSCLFSHQGQEQESFDPEGEYRRTKTLMFDAIRNNKHQQPSGGVLCAIIILCSPPRRIIESVEHFLQIVSKIFLWQRTKTSYHYYYYHYYYYYYYYCYHNHYYHYYHYYRYY